MSKAKATANFIHSYKGYMLILGGVLMIAGYVLSYIAPRPETQIKTDWVSGAFPSMSIAGFAVMVVPYLAVYLIQTIASKFGKKTEPPVP
jgi:hypothetical protein